jgi:site-specific DNA recombinase
MTEECRPRAVGYVRVSTEEQAKYGQSLDAQTAAIREYCNRKNVELVDVYREEGKSATKDISEAVQ